MTPAPERRRTRNRARKDRGPLCPDGGRQRSDPPAAREVSLPPEVGDPLATLFGADAPPRSLGEFLDALGEVADGVGDALTVEMLCLTDESPHRARTADGESYAFQCILDALLLPAAGEGSAEVWTVDPVDGTEIRARVSETAVEVDPAGAVLSFGVEPSPDPLGPDPELGSVYGAMCHAIKGFADRENYEAWAADARAATVAVPLSTGFDFGRELAAVL